MSDKRLNTPGLQHFYDRLINIFALVADIPTKTSDLTNDSGYITQESDPTVPSWAKAQTKPTYTAAEVGAQSDVGFYIDAQGYLCQRIGSDS